MDNQTAYTNTPISQPTNNQPPVQSLPNQSNYGTPLPNTSQPQQQTPPPPPPERKPFFSAKFLKIGLIIFGIMVFLCVVLLFVALRTPKEEKVTITFWGLWEDPAVMQSVISSFEKDHPLITVKYVKQDLNEYRERLAARIPNGAGPDVYVFHNTWTSMMRSLLLPVPQTVMDTKTFQQTYYPVTQYDLVRQGALYGIPMGMDTLSLFVNTSLQQAAGVSIPQNWDDFSKAAQTATVRDDSGKIKTAGAALGTVDNIDHADDIISLLFIQNGVSLQNFPADPTKITEGLKYYTQYATGDTTTWDSTLDPSRLAFALGNLVFYFGYSQDISAIKERNANLQYKIYPVPSLPNRTMTIASYWSAGVSSKSKYQEQAFTFLKYLSEKKTAQKLFQEEVKVHGFWIPYARVDLANNLKDDAILGAFIKQAPLAQSTYFTSYTFDNGINTKVNAYLDNAVRSILSNTPPESATETLTQGVVQVIGQYGL